MCVGLIAKNSHTCLLWSGDATSLSLSPAAFSRPLSLASRDAQNSAENPKQWVLLNTEGVNVVKERKEMNCDLVKPHSRKLVCLQYCQTPLTGCLAFREISVCI